MTAIWMMHNPALAEDKDLIDRELIRSADKVLEQARIDNIAAAKRANVIFSAATHLADKEVFEQAAHYFHAGLQLDPWNLDQQLSYAKLHIKMGNPKEASKTASIVFENSERQHLLEESSAICKRPLLAHVQQLPQKPINEISFCFVRIGHVEDWIVQHSGKMLSKTLNAPVFVHPQIIGLPKPHRSYLARWVEHVKADIQWEHPLVQAQMKELGVESKQAASIDESLEILARILEFRGEKDVRRKLQQLRQQATKQDEQWDAEKLFPLFLQALPNRENVVYVGITDVDIYGGQSNYVFGLAHAPSQRALVSYARFAATFNNDRENQKRFLERLHKQLLSSTGLALSIPRPTDPRSARSYSRSLAEHDRKNITMSDQCIHGFERVLGHKLPEKALNK